MKAIPQDSNHLSENHRRIVSSRIQMIESKIIEIEEILAEYEQPLLDEIIEPLTREEAGQLVQKLQQIKSMLADLADRYELRFYKKSQRAMVLTRLSHILDISEDMYAEKLRGYGSFNSKIKQGYNRDIEELEMMIKKTFAPFHKHKS